jgi:hypothetical protein
MQVTNQSFFVEELERAVAFGVDGVSEVAFNCWKYRDDRAALMVVGCIVDLLANRKFRHRELLAWLLKTTRCGHLDGRSMSRPQRKGCDAGHVQRGVEREAADLEASIGGTVDRQTSAMDIFGIFLMISQARRQNRRAPQTAAVG